MNNDQNKEIPHLSNVRSLRSNQYTINLSVICAIGFSICFLVMMINQNIFSNQSTLEDLSEQYKVAQAKTEERRKTFKDVIKKAEFDEFIEYKTIEKEIELQIKHYINYKEQKVIDSEDKVFLEEEAKKEVLREFINQVLTKHESELSDFKKLLGYEQKLPAMDSLKPEAKKKAYQLKENVRNRYGIELYIYEGYRSPERQNELYDQGRSRPGKIVTNAIAWQSSHQYGYAFDAVCMISGKPNWQDCNWKEIGNEAAKLGLEWGGNWEMVDRPHFQIPYSQWEDKDKIKRYVCERKSPVCDDAHYFYDMGIKHSVDPYLLVAIAVADTSLGEHLKTPYNIGNVGNVDYGTDGKTCIGRKTHGCTETMSSWKEGIERMATTTALRKNETVGALSPYPKCHQPNNIHYAKSTKNWFRNVTKVMSELHDKEIGCNFKYKL